MITLSPTPLESHGIGLEPLSMQHEKGLMAAVADGRLWELWYTAVPEPEQVANYIKTALEGQTAGHMLP